MKCGNSRYQTDQLTKKVPQKVLRHIPIIPRLQQMFKCNSIAKFMDYHSKNKSGDGVLRMPTDGSTFREIEDKYVDFKNKPHNVRLSLTIDGVNPFRELRSTYPVWPIVVINNNISLWMSIKREHIMLTMIILGI